MTTPTAKSLLVARALQCLGYHKNESWVTDTNSKHLSTTEEPLLIQKLSINANASEKGSTYSAGYDLFFEKPYIIIEASELHLVSTDISFKRPQERYG